MISAYTSCSLTTRCTPESPGAYVSVLPTSASKTILVSWAYCLGYELNEQEQNDLHCTLICSRVKSPSYYECKPLAVFEANLKGFEYWKGHDSKGYLVALLNSKSLVSRHEVWVTRGAEHSFLDYTPHVTLKTDLTGSTALNKRIQRLSNRFRETSLDFSSESIVDVSW